MAGIRCIVALMRLFTLIALLLFPSFSQAEKDVEIALISEVRSIRPGKPFYFGLHLKHPPGSHTYWKFPGIVGIGTSIKWELPPGFTTGEIEWPAPQIVKMAGHDAQGYEGETLLMIPVTPPQELVDSSVKITAKVSLMCCGKTCSPVVDVPFSITLPAGGADFDPAAQPLFERYRRMIPKQPLAWTEVSVKRESGRILLTLVPELRQRDPFWTDYTPVRFFTVDGQVDTDAKQETRTSTDGTIVVTLIASDTGPKNAESLPGVVEIPTGKIPRWIEINPRY